MTLNGSIGQEFRTCGAIKDDPPLIYKKNKLRTNKTIQYN